MAIGIICGFLAALFNSIGYLFSARFLLHHKSPFLLLILAQCGMLLVSFPFLFWLFPFGSVDHPWRIVGLTVAWVAVFMIGQGTFFTALRYFEASRLSSLLGLKIIVLALMFKFVQHGNLNVWQWLAVVLAAAAGMLFNWSGTGKTSVKGWLLVIVTLFCYSSADLLETELVLFVKGLGYSDIVSALAVTSLVYTVLGLAALPFIKCVHATGPQFRMAFPYAIIWLMSQASLFICFGNIRPVFGNVILATRGPLSVAIGAILPLLGLAALDSKISARKWVQRGVAALIMVGAIALYSWAKTL